MLQQAQHAAQLGFQFLMVSDHIALTPDVRALYAAPFYDPLLTLAWLAPNLPVVELGTTVLVLPYRHPLLVARMASNLDQLSGGRLILGVGIGWSRQEYAALGVPFARRASLTDEYLEVLRAFWSRDPISFVGAAVEFSDVATGPRPAREPHPPIWIGGRSEAALRRAVRFGDAWHPNRATPVWLRDHGLPRVRALAQELGAPVPAFAPRIDIAIAARPQPAAGRSPGHGTLEQIRDDLRELAELGPGHILLDPSGAHEGPASPYDARHSLELLAERVLDLERGAVT
jgi:probable F420-dependent oxidoreductase